MKNIVIVGVGALGSHVVQFIRNLDATVKVIDFDRVEQKNVLSQFHAKTSVGQNKAQALVKAFKFLFGLVLKAVPHKLTADNVEKLLGDADLVVDCLDNGASRRLIQTFVRNEGIPCLHGGLAADGQLGRIVWDAGFRIDDEPDEAAATCENGEFLPLIALTSAYMARSIQEFLESGRQLSYQVYPISGATQL
jgi:molybdopterin/thiamine biosynthesis adenylyltransferase